MLPKATAPTIPPSHVKRAQAAINAGGPWRADQRSVKEPWVGIPIAAALDLNLERAPQRRMVVNLVRDWLKAGWLKLVPGQDAHRKARDYIEVGKVPVDEDIPL